MTPTSLDSAAWLCADQKIDTVVKHTTKQCTERTLSLSLASSKTTLRAPLQVTFLNAASTARELKLLHAPSLASAFRLLPIHLVISAQDAGRQLQHSITVGSNIPVQRFLKVEMSGLAVDSAAGKSCCFRHPYSQYALGEEGTNQDVHAWILAAPHGMASTL